MNHSLPPLIDRALAAAVRAPSPCNTQPWRFVVTGERIDVLLDHSRVLSVADPDAREARLACGAAVFNLSVTLRDGGRSVSVMPVPQREKPDLVATVRIRGSRVPTSEERRLAEAVPRRHTNRRPFSDRAVSAASRVALINAARHSDARLELIGASAHYDAIASLIRQAHHLQAEDGNFLSEMRYWTGRPADHIDGVPTSAAGPPPQWATALPLRHFHGAETLPTRPYEQQPLLGALLTRTRGERQDVLAGMAMQHVLLTATSLGLSTSFLAQPFETASTRTALAELFHAEGEIHTLLRIGYGHPAATVPRRPVSDVANIISEKD